MIAEQIEFPLAVAICAWCRAPETHTSDGHVSHGICPRHLRKLKLSLQGIALSRRRSARRQAGPQAEPCLPL